MKEPTTVLDPRVGDGWCGPHVQCVGRTVHSDWIVTVFSNPKQMNPLDPA